MFFFLEREKKKEPGNIKQGHDFRDYLHRHIANVGFLHSPAIGQPKRHARQKSIAKHSMTTGQIQGGGEVERPTAAENKKRKKKQKWRIIQMKSKRLVQGNMIHDADIRIAQ